MNKIFSILIALLLCLSLCACDGGETTEADTSEILDEESSDVADSSTDTTEEYTSAEIGNDDKENTGAGIGDNDKDNLVSAIDISAQ